MCVCARVFVCVYVCVHARVRACILCVGLPGFPLSTFLKDLKLKFDLIVYEPLRRHWIAHLFCFLSGAASRLRDEPFGPFGLGTRGPSGKRQFNSLVRLHRGLFARSIVKIDLLIATNR